MTDLTELCSGSQFNGQELFDFWKTVDCPGAYAAFMNNSDPLYQYNSNNLSILQNQVVNLFNTYFETNSLTDDINSSQYNSFQITLNNLCIDQGLPGICTEFLNSYCANYTRDQVTSSRILTNMCGCYVPPDPTILQYTSNSACDPLCNRAETSQQSVLSTGELLLCSPNVCVIDNTNINLENSTIKGSVNFNSICAGCGGGQGGQGCLCIVSGTNINETMASVGIATNFNEFCGSSSVCIVEDSNNNVISAGPCTTIDFNVDNIPLRTFFSWPNLGISILIFVILILTMVSLIAIRLQND